MCGQGDNGGDAATNPLHAVEAIVVRVAAMRTPGPILVGMDGLGGAGKSTLAKAVAHAGADVTVVPGDDFYGPEERDWRTWTAEEGYERFFDHRRLEGELLEPLRSGRSARYQRYDWSTHALGQHVDVPPVGVVLVEGVYLLRPRLRIYWDLTAFVDTPRDLRLRRLRSRGENDDGWIASWMAAEDHYERTENPAATADIVLSGA